MSAPPYRLRRELGRSAEQLLLPAILFAGFHHAHEAANSVNLLAVCFAELLESGHQIFRRLTFGLNLLLNLLKQSIEFHINFKQLEFASPVKPLVFSPSKTMGALSVFKPLPSVAL